MYPHQKLNCVADTRPNHFDALSPYGIALPKIQRDERRAFSQHLRQARRPLIPCVIPSKIQRCERRTLPQNLRQARYPVIPYAIVLQNQSGERRARPKNPRQAPSCNQDTAWRAPSTPPTPPPGSEPARLGTHMVAKFYGQIPCMNSRPLLISSRFSPRGLRLRCNGLWKRIRCACV